MKKILCLIAMAVMACGPRSGIHTDEEQDAHEIDDVMPAPQPVCGNAVIEDQNAIWAEKVLGMSRGTADGYKLFKQNCAVCHSLGDIRLSGPGLKGLYDRIPEPKAEWLRQYILNNLKVHRTKDAYAKKLRAMYPDTMTVFEGTLTDAEVNALMIYVVGNTRY